MGWDKLKKEIKMIRVTEYCLTKEELQFAFDQIEKYNPGEAFFRQNNKGYYAVYRQNYERLNG